MRPKFVVSLMWPTNAPQCETLNALLCHKKCSAQPSTARNARSLAVEIDRNLLTSELLGITFTHLLFRGRLPQHLGRVIAASKVKMTSLWSGRIFHYLTIKYRESDSPVFVRFQINLSWDGRLSCVKEALCCADYKMKCLCWGKATGWWSSFVGRNTTWIFAFQFWINLGKHLEAETGFSNAMRHSLSFWQKPPCDTNWCKLFFVHPKIDRIFLWHRQKLLTNSATEGNRMYFHLTREEMERKPRPDPVITFTHLLGSSSRWEVKTVLTHDSTWTISASDTDSIITWQKPITRDSFLRPQFGNVQLCLYWMLSFASLFHTRRNRHCVYRFGSCAEHLLDWNTQHKRQFANKNGLKV